MGKILIFTGGYVPAKLYGGPVISIKNIVQVCGDDFAIKVVASNRDHDQSRLDVPSNVWVEAPKCMVQYLDPKDMTISNCLKILKQEMPDMVYCNSFFSPVPLIASMCYCNRYHKKLLIAPRGQFMENALRIKSLKKFIYIKLFNLFAKNKHLVWHSTCENETKSIYNHTHVNQLYQNENITLLDTVETSHQKEKDAIRLVYIARIHPIKGLILAMEALAHLPFAVVFDIYGPMEDENYWMACDQIAQRFGPNIKVYWKGVLPHEKIRETLTAYDAFILPSKTENYGHSIVEALLCGRPVIISDNTPWSNVKEYHCGYVASQDSAAEYATYIQDIARMSQEEYNQLIENNKRYVNDTFRFEENKRNYIRMFNDLI